MRRRILGVTILLVLLMSAGCATQTTGRGSSDVAAGEAAELYDLAEAYYRNNFMAKALQHYLTVLERHPRSPEAPTSAFKAGSIYLDKRSPEKAAYYFELLASQYPDHPDTVEAHYYLGICRTTLKEYDQAVTALGYYVNTRGAKHVNQARVLLADSYAATDRFPDALLHYAAAARDLDRGEQVEVLKKVRRMVDNKMAPADLLSIIPRLADGPVTDFTRLRAAEDLVQQGRRAEAATLLRAINFTKKNFKFYDKAEKLLDVAEAQSPKPITRPGEPDVPFDVGMPVAPIPSVAVHAVGVLLPLTGPRAVFGREVLHGIMQGTDLFGGDQLRPYRVVLRDTEGDPEVAARLVNELADDEQVIAIIGPLVGKCAVEASAEAERRGIPLIALTTREDILERGQWTFRNFLTASDQVQALIDYATNHQGALRFAVLYPDTAQGRRFRELFERELDAKRYRLVATASYAPDETDFKDTLINLRTQGSFDALFLPDNARRVALVAPQLVYYGIKNVLLLGINSWNQDDLARKAGSYLTHSVVVDGFFLHSTSNPEVEPFVRGFENAFQHRPSFLAAVGFDTARMVATALRTDVADRHAMRRRLFGIHDFAGVTGELTIDETRDTRRRLYLLRVGDGRIEELF